MPYIDAFEGILSTQRGRRIMLLGGLAVALFVALDWAVVHPHIWQNDPAPFYFAIKPVVVGLGLVGTAWLLTNENVPLSLGLLAGGVVGVVYLQLYYTAFPIPMQDGTAVQIGLVGNLTEGLAVHLGAFALALAVVLLASNRMGGDA